MSTKSKSKKKILIVACVIAGGLVILVVGVFLGILILSMDVDMEIDDDWLTTEQLESFVETVTRPDLINEPIELVLLEEITPSYVNGVDYFSEDIEKAFNHLYDISTSSTTMVRNPDTVIEKSRTHSAQAPLSLAEFYSEKQVWEGMGDVLISHMEDRVSDFKNSNMYDTIHEPGFWTDLGKALVSDITKEYGEEKLDAEQWASLVHEKMADFIPILSDEIIGTNEIEEVIDKYFEERWAEFDAAPNAGKSDSESPSSECSRDNYIKAKDYPVSYRTLGRLFYREALQSKEQLAYDVVVTAIQKGQFVVECDFGVSADEMRNVVTAIRYDFPELFFLGLRIGYTGDVLIKDIDIVIDDDYQKMGIDKALLEIATRVNPVVSVASKLETDIEKVKYIVDDLCKKISYPKINWEDWDTARKIVSARQDIWSAIVWNDTVCAGYAAAFHHYMKLLGIDATIVTSPGHRWNLLELDGDYYYMDVTAIDTGGDYSQFNFNEAKVAEIIAEERMGKDAYQRVGYSTKLPAANGTKYYYYNWYGKDESEPAKQEPIRLDGQSILINGTDVSSRLLIMDFEGVLYAEGKSFIESITAPGVGSQGGWFRYDFTIENGDIRVTNNGGDLLFSMPLSSRQLVRSGHETIDMSNIIKYHEETVFIPMLAFCEALSQMEYEVEIIINGERNIYKPQSGTQSDPGDESEARSDPPLDSQDWVILDWGESSELIEDWRKGPTSLGEEMEASEVIAGIAGRYVGYYNFLPYQIAIVFNEDNLTGYWEERGLEAEWPAISFTFSFLEGVDHPMLDNTYNGMIFVECEDGTSSEFVVVSPTVLYEPQYEAIFYKVE